MDGRESMSQRKHRVTRRVHYLDIIGNEITARPWQLIRPGRLKSIKHILPSTFDHMGILEVKINPQSNPILPSGLLLSERWPTPQRYSVLRNGSSGNEIIHVLTGLLEHTKFAVLRLPEHLRIASVGDSNPRTDEITIDYQSYPDVLFSTLDDPRDVMTHAVEMSILNLQKFL